MWEAAGAGPLWPHIVVRFEADSHLAVGERQVPRAAPPAPTAVPEAGDLQYIG